LQDGHRYTSVVQVRKDGVRTFLDGRLMVHWKTDFHDLADPYPSGRHPGQPGVVVYECRATIHRIAVVEVTGKGRIITASSPSTAPVVQPSGRGV
jgi:hypothetical protein